MINHYKITINLKGTLQPSSLSTFALVLVLALPTGRRAGQDRHDIFPGGHRRVEHDYPWITTVRERPLPSQV